jgi:hypothetical protein
VGKWKGRVGKMVKGVKIGEGRLRVGKWGEGGVKHG